MIRTVIFVVMIIVSAYCSAIQKKITISKKKLYQTSKKIAGMNLTLSKLARSIKQMETELNKIDKEQKKLSQEYQNLSQEYQQKKEEYEKLQNAVRKLKEKSLLLKQNLVLLISNNFSKSILLSAIKNPTQQDVLNEEVLKAIQSKESEMIKKMGTEYQQTIYELETKNKRVLQLQQQLQKVADLQKKLSKLKTSKAKKLQALTKKKSSYNRQLQELMDQKESLAKTLRKLQIMVSKKHKRAKNLKVKKYGQKSYKRIKTTHYRGPKTIAPLDRFLIVKRFGVYKDPIYNIEIPNENIELKPLESNAKVRNVLNGKIILAKWTPHLKYVVIVKHSNNLYTIYANLDKLDPYIKKGRRIKKGYTLGRVNTKLIFEVTKNQAHINPLELIRIKG